MPEETPTHAICNECGKKVKKSISQESDDWEHTDDGWLCPHCNPNSDVSW